MIGAVLLALGLTAFFVVRLGLRPLSRIEVDRRPDRRRRPLAARQPGDPEDRGRTARARAERDARPARAGVRGAHGQRRAPAPVPRRRLARAAHAARLDPRLRRALQARRGARPGRAPRRDAPHRGGVQAHGRARRGPARAGAPGRAARARAASRSTSRRSPATRSRTRRARAPEREIALSADGPAVVAGDAAAAAPGVREPARQRDRPHPRRHADRGRGRRRSGARHAERDRPRRRASRSRSASSSSSASGAARAGASAGAPAPGSGWRSSRAWCTRTTARSPCATSPGGGAAFVVELPARCPLPRRPRQPRDEPLPRSRSPELFLMPRSGSCEEERAFLIEMLSLADHDLRHGRRPARLLAREPRRGHRRADPLERERRRRPADEHQKGIGGRLRRRRRRAARRPRGALAGRARRARRARPDAARRLLPAPLAGRRRAAVRELLQDVLDDHRDRRLLGARAARPLLLHARPHRRAALAPAAPADGARLAARARPLARRGHRRRADLVPRDDGDRRRCPRWRCCSRAGGSARPSARPAPRPIRAAPPRTSRAATEQP